MKPSFQIRRETPERPRVCRPEESSRGFSLLEMLIALAMFVVVSGVAFSLLRQHQPLFNRQQNMAGLNIAMRNAAAQLQLDLSNAGTGFYAGANIPGFPVGVTVSNSDPGGGCNNAAAHTYGPNCFDSLNVIAVDSNTPLAHPTNNGSNCVSTTSAVLFATPTGPTTLAQLAAAYHTGDQILVVKSDGSQMTTAILTHNGQVAGAKVQLQHNPTGADGSNSAGNDPLGISVNSTNKLGEQFCDTDWVMKLSPIRYAVDATDTSNPKLTRTQGGSTAVLADQIIGFKIGVATWNSPASTDTLAYSFDASSYGYDYTLIRSLRLSLIGRTTPVPDPNYNYRNALDQGPYQIQGISVVVNPRNLSMRD
jgi:prepilin-type N-terminal cleavage/methylation domain-containing protein